MTYFDLLQKLRELKISVFCCMAQDDWHLPEIRSDILNVTNLPSGLVKHFAGFHRLRVPSSEIDAREGRFGMSNRWLTLWPRNSDTITISGGPQSLNIGPLITCCALVFFAGCETRGKYKQLSGYHLGSGVDCDERDVFEQHVHDIWRTLSVAEKANSRFLYTCPLRFDQGYLKSIKSYTEWLTGFGFSAQNMCVFDCFNVSFVHVGLNGYFGIGMFEGSRENLSARQARVPALSSLVSQIDRYRRHPDTKVVPKIMNSLAQCKTNLLVTYQERYRDALTEALSALDIVANQYANWFSERQHLGFWERHKPPAHKAQADIFDSFLRILSWPVEISRC